MGEGGNFGAKIILMSTQIYGVDYWITEYKNGKRTESYKESKNVVAKNALDAILKVRTLAAKPYSYTDEDTKKKVTITRPADSFEPINSILRASTD